MRGHDALRDGKMNVKRHDESGGTRVPDNADVITDLQKVMDRQWVTIKTG